MGSPCCNRKYQYGVFLSTNDQVKHPKSVAREVKRKLENYLKRAKEAKEGKQDRIEKEKRERELAELRDRENR